MRRLAAVLSVALLAGCAHTVTGAALPAMSASKILPTEAEISSAAGTALSTFGFRPFVGGSEILPDGYRTDADAAPIACAEVTDTAPRRVYQTLPVVEAARQSYFNWDEGVDTSGADAAVVRLSTATAAKDAFDAFAGQWRQCAGTTVVKHVQASVIDAVITDVAVHGPVVSATVRTRQLPSGATSRYERAVGVRGSTLVEVSVAVTPTGEKQANPRASAVRVAEVMLGKTQ